MPRDYKVFLEDILKSANKILTYAEKSTFEEFVAGDLTHDGIIYNLMIIGEAAKNVPPEMREEYSTVEWNRVIQFRNIAAHEYYQLTDERIWDFIQNKLPEIKRQVQHMYDEE